MEKGERIVEGKKNTGGPPTRKKTGGGEKRVACAKGRTDERSIWHAKDEESAGENTRQKKVAERKYWERRGYMTFAKALFEHAGEEYWDGGGKKLKLFAD